MQQIRLTEIKPNSLKHSRNSNKCIRGHSQTLRGGGVNKPIREGCFPRNCLKLLTLIPIVWVFYFIFPGKGSEGTESLPHYRLWVEG